MKGVVEWQCSRKFGQIFCEYCPAYLGHIDSRGTSCEQGQIYVGQTAPDLWLILNACALFILYGISFYDNDSTKAFMIMIALCECFYDIDSTLWM